MDHDWTFLAVGGNETDQGRVLAVCKNCGTIRSSELPSIGSHVDKLDLTGECEGREDATFTAR